jgi:hypothetical protein
MPLPDGFNEWEHLQHTVKKAHNNTVKDFFRDQADDDIGTAKGAAKHACLMKDGDTAPMTTLRMWLFWVVCRKMRDNFEPYYGIPIAAFDAEVKYRPQITCYFLEDHNDVEQGYRPVEGQLSIRLMNDTSQTLSKGELTSLANKINTEFGQGQGFVWDKGKDLYSYVDKANGHRFKILSKNQTDAIAIIRKLLDIANDTYQDEFLRLNEAIDASSAFPNVSGTQTILGKTYKKPRKRPLAKVRFIYASIKVHGLPKPIVLVDKSGYWSEAIVKAW